MKKILTLTYLLILTGCSTPRDKQTIDLKCENGLVTYKWYKATIYGEENVDIRQVPNLKHSGFYTDDSGKYMKCIEEDK